MDEHVQGRQNFPDRAHGRWRVLVSAQVDDHPCHVSQEGDRDVGADELEEGLDHAQFDDIISQMRAIADYVTWKSKAM